MAVPGRLLCVAVCFCTRHGILKMSIDILSFCDLGHHLAAHPPRYDVDTIVCLRKAALNC